METTALYHRRAVAREFVVARMSSSGIVDFGLAALGENNLECVYSTVYSDCPSVILADFVFGRD